MSSTVVTLGRAYCVASLIAGTFDTPFVLRVNICSLSSNNLVLFEVGSS